MQLPEEKVEGQAEEQADWEVTPEGLYVATRGFLMRRGYCCANRCRNCPYINWLQQASWQPIPLERAHHMRVSARAVSGAQDSLRYHQQRLHHCSPAEQDYHWQMITHYQGLLARWGALP